MTKAELVARMAAAGGWTKVGADKALRALLNNIQRTLKRGQSVTLAGFGTFSVSRRKPRKGRNPRTGQPIEITGGKVPRFRPSKALKKVVG
ncbi:MAG: HU family DNA-binding protein [candidate division NC10 bacterium]|jgi:DNA-binding protein HU-beta